MNKSIKYILGATVSLIALLTVIVSCNNDMTDSIDSYGGEPEIFVTLGDKNQNRFVLTDNDTDTYKGSRIDVKFHNGDVVKFYDLNGGYVATYTVTPPIDDDGNMKLSLEGGKKLIVGKGYKALAMNAQTAKERDNKPYNKDYVTNVTLEKGDEPISAIQKNVVYPSTEDTIKIITGKNEIQFKGDFSVLSLKIQKPNDWTSLIHLN